MEREESRIYSPLRPNKGNLDTPLSFSGQGEIWLLLLFCYLFLGFILQRWQGSGRLQNRHPASAKGWNCLGLHPLWNQSSTSWICSPAPLEFAGFDTTSWAFRGPAGRHAHKPRFLCGVSWDMKLPMALKSALAPTLRLSPNSMRNFVHICYMAQTLLSFVSGPFFFLLHAASFSPAVFVETFIISNPNLLIL